MRWVRDSIFVMPSNRQQAVRASAGRLPFLLAATTMAVVFGASGDVSADTAKVADQLKNHPDFRIRTAAALSLGQSDDVEAVKPLCGCLDSGTETESVRVACAAALGKLKKPGSGDCLKAHSSDKSSKVSEQVAASLKSLGPAANLGSGGSSSGGSSGTFGDPSSLKCPGAPATGKPKYFVGIDVKNKTSRPDSDIKALIWQEVACKLLGNGGRFKLTGELDPVKMTSAAKSAKLDGYYLQMQVDPIKYDNGALSISMKLTMMTSERDLKGEIGKSLTSPGVTSPSKSEEDDLLKMAARKLADSFADLKP